MDHNSTSDDNDYEDEECLIYVDLDTKLLDDQLTNPNTKIKFLGIDTDSPIMQFNNKIFKGSYDYAMGTNVFFAQSQLAPEPDPSFREIPKRMYEYFAKSNKVLKMKRIFVEEKDSDRNGMGVSKLAEGECENLEHLRVSKSYAEALNQFLKPGEKPPRLIVETTENDEVNIPLQEADEVKAEQTEMDVTVEEESAPVDGIEDEIDIGENLNKLLNNPDFVP